MSEEAADADGGVLLNLKDLQLSDTTSITPSLTDSTPTSPSSPVTVELKAEVPEVADNDDVYLSENGISYSGYTPKEVLNCRDGKFYATHFHDCALNDVNFDNCVMINVSFKDCIFDATKWSNVYMEEVEVVDCVFNDYILQNDRREDITIVGETHEQETEIGGWAPEEVEDAEWLKRKKDGVAETMRTAKGFEERAYKSREESAKAMQKFEESARKSREECTKAKQAYAEKFEDQKKADRQESAMERDIRTATSLNEKEHIRSWYELAQKAEAARILNGS